MKRDAESLVPHAAAVAAEARSLPPRRRRRLSWAPYALVAPVLIAIGLVLGYPIENLVSLSFQRYGLFELIQHKGHWIGLRNSARSSTTGSSGTRSSGPSSSRSRTSA